MYALNTISFVWKTGCNRKKGWISIFGCLNFRQCIVGRLSSSLEELTDDDSRNKDDKIETHILLVTRQSDLIVSLSTLDKLGLVEEKGF